MRLRGEEALRGLSALNPNPSPKDKLKPVYLLAGDHAWLREKLAAKLRELTVPDKWRSMNAETVWADETAEAEAADMARTPPFGSDRRFLLIRNVEAYRGDSASSQDSAFSSGAAAGKPRRRPRGAPAEFSPLLECVRDPSPSAVLVLLSERWDFRRWEEDELFTAVGESGAIAECMRPHGESLRGWIAEEARSLGMPLEDGAVQELVERTGEDPLLLRRELEKLASYVDEGRTVTIQNVLALTGELATPDVFHFLDVLFVERKPGRALSLLARLIQDPDMHPLRLHALLVTQMRKMIALKGAQASGLNKWEMARQIRLPPSLVDSLGLMVRRTSSERLAELVSSLAGAETDLKRGHDGREVLEGLILNCCR